MAGPYKPRWAGHESKGPFCTPGEQPLEPRSGQASQLYRRARWAALPKPHMPAIMRLRTCAAVARCFCCAIPANPLIFAAMSLSQVTCDTPSALRAHLKQGERVFAKLAFSGADLSSLDLSGCTFEDCDLSGIDLRHADVRDTQWRRCRMARARLDGVKANGATFTACDLANTEWQRARIDGASFADCRLTGAQLTVEAGLIGATFAETRLVAARIIGLTFRKMTLERLDFSEADLRGCDFREAIFSSCSLRDASFKDCKFKEADLRGCDLGDLSLAQAKLFEGATISQEQAADIMTTFGFVVA